MDKSFLVRIFGFPATLLHGDPLVLDRWLWLRRRLPRTRNGERLIDIGCGSGAFTIGAALRGYSAVGISWDERNAGVAKERAELVGARDVVFPIHDVRQLDQLNEFKNGFDVAICFENVEHILDDRRLIQSIHECLKPGGMLLLTTPNYYYRAIKPVDDGPFSRTEDGNHVRRGYTPAMLKELCVITGFTVEEISYCSGFLSQKLSWLMRCLPRWPLAVWAVTAPLRVFPPLLDGVIGKLSAWPYFSICLVAYKGRFEKPGR